MDLKAEQATGSLVILSNVDDDKLGALYRDAAFCVYPSEYEGYGLPVVEAFLYGKAVVASTGGALPEVTKGLVPCLEQGDTAAWAETMAEWIEQPALRAKVEASVQQYTAFTWEQAVPELFRVIEREATRWK
jgi:glycosyltransferase involved in cell wall biosynthesis